MSVTFMNGNVQNEAYLEQLVAAATALARQNGATPGIDLTGQPAVIGFFDAPEMAKRHLDTAPDQEMGYKPDDLDF